MKTAQATINLSAVTYNAKLAIQQAGNENIFAVVKNYAYHFGLKQIIKTLYHAGIRHFATTSLTEAKKIRDWYEDVYILSLNTTTDFETLKNYRIACTLSSLDYLKAYEKYMLDIEWHLEWAGEMRRSGATSRKELLEILKISVEKNIQVSGLWTHFSWADEFNEQYELEKSNWLEIVEFLTQLMPFKYIHSQNSASFVRENGLLSNHSHARIGIYLYGCLPYENAPIQLAHALEVSGTIINIITLSKGESLGYNNAFIAESNDTRIAIVNIGYGDGILRKRLLNQDVLIHNNRYRCVSVMMSHCAIIIDNAIDIGQSVTIYGPNIPVHEFTFKGCGANSEQISPLNFETLHRNYIL